MDEANAWQKWRDDAVDDITLGAVHLSGFEHQCGALTGLPENFGTLGNFNPDNPTCSGCGYDLERPEECVPLYRKYVPFPTHDREPQPSDGPDYHFDHKAWKSRLRR